MTKHCKYCSLPIGKNSIKMVCKNHYDKLRYQLRRDWYLKYFSQYYKANKNSPWRISSTRKAVKKYESTHPERLIAWRAAGKLPKEPCVVCGEVRVDRHHPDVDKPEMYVCLCRKHHIAIERGNLSLPTG